MTPEEIRDSISKMEHINDTLDNYAENMAKIITLRLKKINRWTLANLKHELSFFNAQTGKWRNDPQK